MKASRILIVLASLLTFVLYKGCQPENEDPYKSDQAIRPDEEVTGLI